MRAPLPYSSPECVHKGRLAAGALTQAFPRRAIRQELSRKGEEVKPSRDYMIDSTLKRFFKKVCEENI